MCTIHLSRAFMLLVTVQCIMCEKTIKMLGITPMTGKGWIGGGSCIPPIQMAIDDVNASPDILNGYTLAYDYIDSECNAGVGVYKMMKALEYNATYIMLLGGGCSTVSESTSQVSYLWNLTQLSYGSSSPVLSEVEMFPKFFRLGVPDQKHTNARLDLFRKYKWKKIATIHQALQFFSVVIEKFVKQVENSSDISIETQEIFVQDPWAAVQNLKDQDARIIVTAMYENKARAVLCAAYKVGLYGPKVVWVFSGWYSAQFWNKDLHEVDCTNEQMALVIEGAFLTAAVYKNDVEERGVANITASEFFQRFLTHPLYDKNYQSTDFVAYQCYDHVWLAALALNCTIGEMKKSGHPKSLEQFTYADGDINDIIYECMSNSNLLGVAGNIHFTRGGDPDRVIWLTRIQDGEVVRVGVYRQDLKPSYYEWIEGAIQWKDGIIPRDSTYTTLEEVVVSSGVYVSMCTLSGLGILLAMFFFIFNITYRSNKTVKLSSPNINSILLLGCILCYSTVFIDTTNTTNASICRAKTMCFSLGFTITFGSLFTKTWRVYRIFTNKKLLRRSIKDIQLLVIIGGLVVVVMIVLVIWEVIAPHVMIVQILESEVYMIGNDALVRPFVRVCYSDYSMYFGWAIYIIEGTLLCLGAFLAWETRKVTIEALNDSQHIGLCLYNVVILSAVGLTVSLLLDQHVIILYGVTSGLLIIGTTVTQLVVFVPKVYAVFTKVDIQVHLVAPTNGSTVSAVAASCSSRPDAEHT